MKNDGSTPCCAHGTTESKSEKRISISKIAQTSSQSESNLRLSKLLEQTVGNKNAA